MDSREGEILIFKIVVYPVVRKIFQCFWIFTISENRSILLLSHPLFVEKQFFFEPNELDSVKEETLLYALR